MSHFEQGDHLHQQRSLTRHMCVDDAARLITSTPILAPQGRPVTAKQRRTKPIVGRRDRLGGRCASIDERHKAAELSDPSRPNFRTLSHRCLEARCRRVRRRLRSRTQNLALGIAPIRSLRINVSNSTSAHFGGLGSHSRLGYRLRITDRRARPCGSALLRPSVMEGGARHEGRIQPARHSGFPVVGHAGQRTALTTSCAITRPRSGRSTIGVIRDSRPRLSAS